MRAYVRGMASAIKRYQDVCRVCTKQSGELQRIFQDDILAKLTQCVDVVIAEEEGLPGFICSECLQSLEIAYDFRQLCARSDAEMRQALLAETELCRKTLIEADCEMVKEEPLFKTESLEEEPRAKYHCGICNKTFGRSSRLARHLCVLNPGEKSVVFSCEECSQEFEEQEALSSHMKVHEADEHEDDSSTNLFLCEFCPRTFATVLKLSRHVKIHSPSQTHKCDVCSKGFAVLDQLNHHMKKHKTERPHVCPICHKRFQQSCTLKDHLRTHSGETRKLALAPVESKSSASYFSVSLLGVRQSVQKQQQFATAFDSSHWRKAIFLHGMSEPVQLQGWFEVAHGHAQWP